MSRHLADGSIEFLLVDDSSPFSGLGVLASNLCVSVSARAVEKQEEMKLEWDVHEVGD